MKAGNGDEMGKAGGAQLFPVFIGQPTRIAEGEGRDEASRCRVGAFRDAHGHLVAPGDDAHRRLETLGRFHLAHVTGRRDAIQQHLPLAIKSARIAQRAWRAQLHPQSPALARLQLPARAEGVIVRSPGVVPRQAKALASQRFGLVVRIVNAQVEAGPARLVQRQVHDAAAYHRLLQLHGGRQLRRHAPGTLPHQHRHPEHEGAGDTPSAPAEQPTDATGQQQRQRPAQRRQLRQSRSQQHAEQQRGGRGG